MTGLRAVVVLSLMLLAFSITCTNYVCETAINSPGMGNCAKYVEDDILGSTVYLSEHSCPNNQICSPFVATSASAVAKCATAPAPAKNQSLVNEPCNTADDDCWSTALLPPGVEFAPKCTNNVCTNFIKSANKCSMSQQCDVGLYCKIDEGIVVGTCTSLIACGDNSCTDDFQCEMNAFCIGADTQPSTQKYCQPNYSLNEGQYCTADYQCASGYCFGFGETDSLTQSVPRNAVCANTRPITTDFNKSLMTCASNDDCAGSSTLNVGTPDFNLPPNCKCGYMASHYGICQPFYGDRYMTNFFNTDKSWRTGNNIQSKCNVTRKGSSICYQVMNGKIAAAFYIKAYAYAYSTLSYVNSGTNTCVTKWFNNVYPAILPGPRPEPKQCTNYVCETQTHSPGAGNCALYVTNENGHGTVYLATEQCRYDTACSPFGVSAEHTTAPCAPNPIPWRVPSLVNEPCPSGDPAIDCLTTADLPLTVYFKPTCRDGVCANFNQVGALCSATSQCEPSLYCSITSGEIVGTCTALKAIGTDQYSKCMSDDECMMNAFCLGAEAQAANKYCTAYYSLTTGKYCTADYQCESGYCYGGNNSLSQTVSTNGICASVRPVTLDFRMALQTCKTSDDCSSSSEFYTTGANMLLAPDCKCGYMETHDGVCQPFYGDHYMTAYLKLDRPWRSKPNSQSICNSIRRGSSICYAVMKGSASAASYMKAAAYAYYPLNYVNSGTNKCITQWFNNIYPPIKPGREPKLEQYLDDFAYAFAIFGLALLF